MVQTIFLGNNPTNLIPDILKKATSCMMDEWLMKNAEN